MQTTITARAHFVCCSTISRVPMTTRWPATRCARRHLSTAVGAQVRAGDARVRVLPAAGSQWFGMTYAADDERVRDQITRLVDAGQYPTNLKAGLERLGCD